jgi:hypothetical protein
MKSNRMFAYLFGCIALLLSFFAYMSYIYQLGFPDGFITELGYAQRKLAYLFIGMNVVFSVCFSYLGTVALRKQIGKPLSAAIIFYLLTIVSVLLIDYYYRLNLMGSGGG